MSTISNTGPISASQIENVSFNSIASNSLDRDAISVNQHFTFLQTNGATPSKDGDPDKKFSDFRNSSIPTILIEITGETATRYQNVNDGLLDIYIDTNTFVRDSSGTISVFYSLNKIQPATRYVAESEVGVVPWTEFTTSSTDESLVIDNGDGTINNLDAGTQYILYVYDGNSNDIAVDLTLLKKFITVGYSTTTSDVIGVPDVSLWTKRDRLIRSGNNTIYNNGTYWNETTEYINAVNTARVAEIQKHNDDL
jgi:hypothetical protein